MTPDGSPVEVYARLPARGVPEFVSAQSPCGSVLDLGAGVGRFADPLVALGHRVIAVDESAEMLARVQSARTVCARIEELRLDERFDVVLLASHLVNTVEAGDRAALLATVAHHLVPGGLALIQWYEPAWFDTVASSVGRIGDVGVELDVESLTDGVLTATVTYEVDGRRWPQRFRSRRLELAELTQEAAAQGLTLAPAGRETWLRAHLA